MKTQGLRVHRKVKNHCRRGFEQVFSSSDLRFMAKEGPGNCGR